MTTIYLNILWGNYIQIIINENNVKWINMLKYKHYDIYY